MPLSSGLSRADTAVPVGGGRQPAAFERASLLVLLAMLLGAAGLLAVRRVAGALVVPLSPAALVFAAIALAAAGAAVRGLGRRGGQDQGRVWATRRPIHVLATASVLTAALSLSLPGSGWLGPAGLWGVVLAGEVLAWRLVRLPPLPRPPQVLRLVRRVRPDRPQRSAPQMTVSELPDSRDLPAAEVFQQFSRRQLADGAEELAGWLRVPFACGQRTENVHVAFCPPFDAAPQLSARQLEGPKARVKTAQLLPYGVRLDLKLLEPAPEDTCVLLQFSARTSTRAFS